MNELWESITGWARENLSDWTMVKVYIACAAAGGAVLLGQTGLNLFGLGGDTDVDADVDVDDLDTDGGGSLNFLSIRALAGFLTFFGLVGWGGTTAGWGPALTIPAAFAAGLSVMILVAFVMRFFVRMASRGNLDPDGALGKGKISLLLQGRSAEFSAMTAGDELPTGSQCRIVKRITADTFEVEPLES